jgi:hypothetical protein
MYRPKLGDWKCPKCHYDKNFRNRTRCFKCSYSNSNVQIERKEGDWDCQSCNTHNFKHRTQCYKCSAPRILDFKDTEAENEEDECRICFMNKKVISFQPCGHIASCNECANRCKKCAICRKPVTNRIRVYI